MTYYERITASKTWTCPKTGRYKIICVGGGASGKVQTSADDSTGKQNAGGTTSFGSYVSVKGGAVTSAVQNVMAVGGYGGYTGVAYGGAGACIAATSSAASSAVINGGCFGETGLGQGAGGGATSNNTSARIAPGRCGDLKVTELDLTANQSISCTIGTGGAAVSVTDGNRTYTGTAGTAGCIDIRFIQ